MGGQRGEEHSTEKDQHLKSAYDELREGCPVWMELRVVTRVYLMVGIWFFILRKMGSRRRVLGQEC